MIKVDKTNVWYKGRFGDIMVEIIMLLRELRNVAGFDEEDFEFIRKSTFMSRKELEDEVREMLAKDDSKKQAIDDLAKEIDSLLDFLNNIKRSQDGKADD